MPVNDVLHLTLTFKKVYFFSSQGKSDLDKKYGRLFREIILGFLGMLLKFSQRTPNFRIKVVKYDRLISLSKKYTFLLVKIYLDLSEVEL